MPVLWIKFDNNSLLQLRLKGYNYFVFVAQSGLKRLYPFKTYNEAIEKKAENSRKAIQDNYIMCVDYALIEIANGKTMADVLVLPK